MIAIAAGVQDLQGDLAAFFMHGVGDRAVAAGRTMRGQAPGKGLGPTGNIGRESARDHQPDIAACALGKVGGEPVEVVAIFQPGMHRPHQHAVLERGEAKVERAQ